MMTLTRRYRFSAAHVLARRDWTPERNLAVHHPLEVLQIDQHAGRFINGAAQRDLQGIVVSVARTARAWPEGLPIACFVPVGPPHPVRGREVDPACEQHSPPILTDPPSAGRWAIG